MQLNPSCRSILLLLPLVSVINLVVSNLTLLIDFDRITSWGIQEGGILDPSHHHEVSHLHPFPLDLVPPTCVSGTTDWESDPFPLSFEQSIYQSRNRDKVGQGVQLDRDHYDTRGRELGWQATRGQTIRRIIQQDIVPRIPGEVLELGPFLNPIVHGPNVKYFDVLDLPGLQARAEVLKYPNVREVNIDYVHPSGNLTAVVPSNSFAMVLSSHVLEHQLDLVRHFQAISRILVDGGVYLLLIPDKRFCFDHFVTESTIADVLDDYVMNSELAASHKLRSVIEHRALTTHNSADRHWSGKHGPEVSDWVNRIRGAWGEWHEGQTMKKYVDVHNYQFTPRGLALIVGTLQELGLIDMRVHQLYETVKGQFEFGIILKKCAPSATVR